MGVLRRHGPGVFLGLALGMAAGAWSCDAGPKAVGAQKRCEELDDPPSDFSGYRCGDSDVRLGDYAGFRCVDDGVHRVSAVACPDCQLVGDCRGSAEFDHRCETDTDCWGTQLCMSRISGNRADCGCEPTCRTDDDCAADEACLCTGTVSAFQSPRCVPAGCRTDADCDSGECGLTTVELGCDGLGIALACRTASDECRVGADCPEEPCGGEPEPGRAYPALCLPTDAGWTCEPDCRGDCG